MMIRIAPASAAGAGAAVVDGAPKVTRDQASPRR
jgi:hypothetical protein